MCVQVLEEGCQAGAGADGGDAVCEVEGTDGCGGGLFDFACGEVGVAEPGEVEGFVAGVGVVVGGEGGFGCGEGVLAFGGAACDGAAQASRSWSRARTPAGASGPIVAQERAAISTPAFWSPLTAW